MSLRVLCFLKPGASSWSGALGLNCRMSEAETDFLQLSHCDFPFKYNMKAQRDLVTILNLSSVDAHQILDVQTGVSLILQPHGVTQNQRDSLTAFPCLHRVGTKLQRRWEMSQIVFIFSGTRIESIQRVFPSSSLLLPAPGWSGWTSLCH